MQNIVDKFISEKNEKGIILELYEKGLKQKEIEQFIIDKFKPFLKSKSILRVQMLAYLPQYIDSLLYILSDNVNKQLFENCLEVFWIAKMEDSINCYKSYQYWQDDVIAATSKIISLITLDQDRSQMILHEFAEDVFTKIGKIIEACIQPYLRILLYLEEIINKKKPSKLDINKLDLGELINKLIKYKFTNKLLISFKPIKGFAISQFNIAIIHPMMNNIVRIPKEYFSILLIKAHKRDFQLTYTISYNF